MKTDLEKFTSLYKKIGVDVTVSSYGGDEVYFQISPDTEGNIDGGFLYSNLIFDKFGNFIKQTIWSY